MSLNWMLIILNNSEHFINIFMFFHSEFLFTAFFFFHCIKIFSTLFLQKAADIICLRHWRNTFYSDTFENWKVKKILLLPLLPFIIDFFYLFFMRRWHVYYTYKFYNCNNCEYFQLSYCTPLWLMGTTHQCKYKT